ncbi:MAG TPA: FKBP-type peptidyl-prolyl cis-trans isomerase [Niabella sp.]|nr:FKBP-type peptidyl-prolyl cis-trans isomerase [Niabella sp.]HOZ97447.1 FKBP-type peptidyl-prolyl cis-trans isomerase [Niabella sp.]HQW15185.1 FKBP-type peptidyl-prolyl cis-trans isomerase [Niabella sp.]HQX20348.1 FKBP-type peptidyl-prolyl cis-trans isomerase [Niabella sp.]HRB08521.1 FKBP-type peptidyl-prolyl cis-trans isomerase [Niabella sp.]
MKRSQILGFAVAVSLGFAACSGNDMKTTANGLKYKIFEGGSKDSSKVGNILKMNMKVELSGSSDTIMTDTHGKLPVFAPIQDIPQGQPYYDPSEVFKYLKKGDSLIAIVYVDSAISKGLVQANQLPPFMKKGDKLTYHYKVIDVFTSDSIAKLDFEKEQVKDAPRAKKEQEEMMAKMAKEQEAKFKKDVAELAKTGEKQKQDEEVKSFIASKGFTATTMPQGAFVKIDNPGNGSALTDGKWAKVKYEGKLIQKDSTFDSGEFPIQIGKSGAIPGFEDGLKAFKGGGKGTIFLPGYLAYGKDGMGGKFKPYAPMLFNVEILSVTDTMPPMAPPVPQPQPAQGK